MSQVKTGDHLIEYSFSIDRKNERASEISTITLYLINHSNITEISNKLFVFKLFSTAAEYKLQFYYLIKIDIRA